MTMLEMLRIESRVDDLELCIMYNVSSPVCAARFGSPYLLLQDGQDFAATGMLKMVANDFPFVVLLDVRWLEEKRLPATAALQGHGTGSNLDRYGWLGNVR